MILTDRRDLHYGLILQEYGMKISMVPSIDSEIVDGVETRLFIMKRDKNAIFGWKRLNISLVGAAASVPSDT